VRKAPGNAANHPDRVVGPWRGKERAVAAIMLNDEHANEQCSCRERQEQGHEIGKPQRPAHRRTGRDKQANRRAELKQARCDDRRFEMPER
jgi:hypothetical protein